MERCDGCNKKATVYAAEGVPMCAACTLRLCVASMKNVDRLITAMTRGRVWWKPSRLYANRLGRWVFRRANGRDVSFQAWLRKDGRPEIPCDLLKAISEDDRRRKQRRERRAKSGKKSRVRGGSGE